jgi:hypothetical protein
MKDWGIDISVYSLLLQTVADEKDERVGRTFAATASYLSAAYTRIPSTTKVT